MKRKRQTEREGEGSPEGAKSLPSLSSEYTPYGETWIDEGSDRSLIGYRFTSKEYDSETGLYYYGARYLDPTTSRWMSADPAMGKYLPEMPLNDAAKQRNRNLPGSGGVFNQANLSSFAYATHNPLRYIDPSGKDVGDKSQYAITLAASVEISRAKTLAASGAAYGSPPGLGGTIVGMNLDKYDCTAAMSAVAQKPYQSTAELANPAVASEHYTEVSAAQYSPGDWVVARYQPAGKTAVEGHAQMRMGEGKYFESAEGLGPTISTKPLEEYLKETKATVLSVTYLRPKESE